LVGIDSSVCIGSRGVLFASGGSEISSADSSGISPNSKIGVRHTSGAGESMCAESAGGGEVASGEVTSWEVASGEGASGEAGAGEALGRAPSGTTGSATDTPGAPSVTETKFAIIHQRKFKM